MLYLVMTGKTSPPVPRSTKDLELLYNQLVDTEKS